MTPTGGPKAGKNILTREFLKQTPPKPGVYLMKDRQGRVIYVGKARDLKKRLTSYGRIPAGRTDKTAILLSRLQTVETIITNTEKEALILEAALIKQHQPKYNILLRDDKNYPLLKVTVAESWPRLVLTRRRRQDKARYFGPFSSAAGLRQTLNYLNNLFPLRRCRGKNLKKRARPCLNFQMGHCPAPCTGKADRQQYLETMRQVLMVLEGRNQHLIRELEQGMKAAAAALDFETAALCRDRIKALTDTLEKQVVVSQTEQDLDVFGLAGRDEAATISVLKVRGGRISGHRSFYLAAPLGRDEEVLAEVLTRYYEDQFRIPREVLLPLIPEGEDLLSEWLTDLRGARVYLKTPQRGHRARLLDLARQNAEQTLKERRERSKSWQELAGALKKTLHLSQWPERIECLDISNLGGQEAVGSLVCFIGGEKAKKFWRHYKIRTVSGPDDYRMMAEVLARRLTAPDGELPDLLLLDGGKGHLQVGIRALAAAGLLAKIELASIAKAKKKTGDQEKIFRPGRKNPIKVAGHSAVLLLLMRIRDEAHRFGIEFHRRQRRKSGLASELDEIPGIGKGKKEILLKSLGGLARIRECTEAELATVQGIGPSLARQIRRHLNKK